MYELKGLLLMSLVAVAVVVVAATAAVVVIVFLLHKDIVSVVGLKGRLRHEISQDVNAIA